MCRTLYITPRRFVVGAVLAGLAMPVSAAGDVALADMDRWRMLEAEQLDEVRGGFEMPDLGLKLSFGLQQSILINGELVSRTVLNLQQLQATIANQVEAARADVISTTAGISAQVQAQVAEQLRAVGLQTTPVTTVTHTGASQPVQGQSASVAQQVAGAPSSVSTATVSQPVVAAPSAGSSTTSVSTAPTHSQPVVAAPATSASTPVATSSTPVVTQSSAQVITPAAGAASIPVAVVQNGAGNSVGTTSVVGNSSSVTTILQNTLDNQRIQVLTEVSASANSLELLREIDFAQSIREGIIGSLRR